MCMDDQEEKHMLLPQYKEKIRGKKKETKNFANQAALSCIGLWCVLLSDEGCIIYIYIYLGWGDASVFTKRECWWSCMRGCKKSIDMLFGYLHERIQYVWSVRLMCGPYIHRTWLGSEAQIRRMSRCNIWGCECIEQMLVFTLEPSIQRRFLPKFICIRLCAIQIRS